MSRRVEEMKESTQIGDEFVLRGETEKGTPTYIKAHVYQKHPYVVVMHRRDRYGKEHTLSWSWVKLVLSGKKTGSR